MKMPRGHLLSLLLSLLTGLLLILVFPGYDVQLLAPFALAPLLIAVARTRSAWRRFVFGWAAGFVFWFGLCRWIQFVLEVHGGMGRWGGWGCFFLFCALKSLHFAVFSCLAGLLTGRPYALPAVAALWTGLERTNGTFGFAWLLLGNAGVSMSVPLRLAPWLGVYGISFVFAMLSVAIACAALRYDRMRLLPLVVLPLLWLLPPIQQHVRAPLSALVVQPNIGAEVDWTDSERDKTEQELRVMSQAFRSSLVIWPEMPAPLYFFNNADFHDEATGIAEEHGAFLFGTVAYDAQNRPLNSAVMLGSKGEEIAQYSKIYLVPFGEFTPPLFSWVNRISQEAGDFEPGREVKTMPALGHQYGVFICYEAAFPHLVRQFVKRGADVLVNLSNDGYFGHLDAREQHLLLVRMRAVENRRFIIRATNDGITAVIDPAGEIRESLPPYKELAAIMHYGSKTGQTFYSAHGDWFAWLCLVAALTLCFYNGAHAYRESRSTIRV
jgi:apolipoprotein N-acyltransferase